MNNQQLAKAGEPVEVRYGPHEVWPEGWARVVDMGLSGGEALAAWWDLWVQIEEARRVHVQIDNALRDWRYAESQATEDKWYHLRRNCARKLFHLGLDLHQVGEAMGMELADVCRLSCRAFDPIDTAMIYDLMLAGHTVASIARQFEKHPTTVRGLGVFWGFNPEAQRYATLANRTAVEATFRE